ncbi:MAG: adenylate/guanylate cyclase domain-containing protein [Proteobacteria bacterium]|nr:adenylate/guanylate cyclase domain-containing protein [Pseudomonadota bacterium]
MQAETKYAKSGHYSIAYQAVGDGPIDLVLVPGFISNVEGGWNNPWQAQLFTRLASFSRLIRFDKRGTGLSDSVSVKELPTLEERMDDVRAVMDAVGSQKAAVLGVSEGGPLSILFAATYPERTHALILYGSFARWLRSDDYPIGMPWKEWHAMLAELEAGWGGPVGLDWYAPSLKDDPKLQQMWGGFLRSGASPAAGLALLRMNEETDVRSALPAIHVPTLVLHRSSDRLIIVEHGRHLAEHIADAKLVELPGVDHIPWFRGGEDVAAEIQEFLTGVRSMPESDRVLAMVMLTDIVGSTERIAAMGDGKWKDLLNRHNDAVRRELARFRGREVKTTGDGFLATFDGPGRAIHCAQAIVDAACKLGVDVRAGLHTGECELLEQDIGGIAVHVAARVAAKAGPGEVLVSRMVKDLVAGSGIRFKDRGRHVMKGVPGKFALYAASAD